ncbi:MAG: A24 family peptidase [Planctomycetia bacterium]
MQQLLANHWQVLFISVLMIVGAVIDGWKLKVPNWLTFPMIFSGWLYWGVSHGWSGISTSVLGALLAMTVLLAMYIIGWMGAGDVKMYAGFGAWMAPIEWFGYSHLLGAMLFSMMLGGVMALVMMWWTGHFYAYVLSMQSLTSEVVGSRSIAEIADKAKERKPTQLLLPYGIPLTIGSLAYIAYMMTYGPNAALILQTASG